MARTNLKVLSVYLNDKDHKTIKDTALLENRSMSNYAGTVAAIAAQSKLTTVDLERAVEQYEQSRKKSKSRK